MNSTVKGYFRTYLKKQIMENKSSIYDVKYIKDKDTKYGKQVIDFIADPKNQYDELEDNSFSSNMMDALSSLSEQDITFIMLKFQENYSNEELAQYFNVSVEEVMEKEISILSILKNNYNIKVMQRTIKDD